MGLVGGLLTLFIVLWTLVLAFGGLGVVPGGDVARPRPLSSPRSAPEPAGARSRLPVASTVRSRCEIRDGC